MRSIESMRLSHLLFIEVLAIVATLAWIIFGVSPVDAATGIPHPVHTPMFRGGAGLERAESLIWPAWLLGSLGVAFFATCFALSMRRNERSVLLLITAAALLYEIVWSCLVLLYWRFANDLPDTLILGFPPPTAWLFYVFTPAPLLFLAIFLFRFEAFIPPDSALDRLRPGQLDTEGGGLG